MYNACSASNWPHALRARVLVLAVEYTYCRGRARTISNADPNPQNESCYIGGYRPGAQEGQISRDPSRYNGECAQADASRDTPDSQRADMKKPRRDASQFNSPRTPSPHREVRGGQSAIQGHFIRGVEYARNVLVDACQSERERDQRWVVPTAQWE